MSEQPLFSLWGTVSTLHSLLQTHSTGGTLKATCRCSFFSCLSACVFHVSCNGTCTTRWNGKVFKCSALSFLLATSSRLPGWLARILSKTCERLSGFESASHSTQSPHVVSSPDMMMRVLDITALLLVIARQAQAALQVDLNSPGKGYFPSLSNPSFRHQTQQNLNN